MREPETDNLETLIPGLKVSKETFRTWRNIRDLCMVIIGMFVMFSIIGAWEFGFCKAKDPNVTFYECITHTKKK